MVAEFCGESGNIAVKEGYIGGEVAGALGGSAAERMARKGTGGEVEFLDEGAGKGGLGAEG